MTLTVRSSNSRCRAAADSGDRCERQGADGRRQAAADEPGLQEVARPGQAALDRADRPLELAGRLFVRLALQVAEHDGIAVFRGQAGELLVEDLADLAIGGGTIIDDGRDLRCQRLEPAPSGRVRPGPHRHPGGHAIKPGPDRVARAEMTRPAHRTRNVA